MKREAKRKPRAFSIDADFPGGNIIVESVAGDTVSLRQDLRDTEGDWFYWCFRVRGAAGRNLTFQFTAGDVIGVRGPAVSTDAGATWAWLGGGAGGDRAFEYGFPEAADDVRFCFGMAYVQADLERFLARHAGHPHLVSETLCTTTKGRRAEVLRFGHLDGRAPLAAVFTCRHHACEMMANYAVEGIAEAVLADNDRGRWFRENVEILAVPFVDKDGAEDGDQGKNRRPHDHGRDYGEGSLYPTVRAIKALVPAWSAGRPLFAADLHCPWIRGEFNEHIYAVGSENEAMWARTLTFADLLKKSVRGPLPYSARTNLPFGKSWNTYAGPKLSFKRWVERQPNTDLALGMEIPYANAGGQEVNTATARAFGRDFAAAVAAWRKGV